jgi:exodeoxyribonuclease VII small subunit
MVYKRKKVKIMEENKKNFEESLQELEVIVKELETGNVDLDNAINKYTEAMKLAKFCSEKLDSATKQVNKILTEDNELKEFVAE